MENLHDRFASALKCMGISRLPCDILHTAPTAVRFAIGGEEPIYLGDHRKPNGVYLENAVERAMAIYDRLPPPDILRIDDCPGLTLPGLPQPDLTVVDSRYWDLTQGAPFLRKLLREIIRAELDAAGMEELTDSVYFLSTPSGVLFHLYDDRRADVAGDAACIHALTEKYGEWVTEK